MKKILLSTIGMMLSISSIYGQIEFTCDDQKFDVKGFEYLTTDAVEGSSNITHYYIKNHGNKVIIKSFLLNNNQINRWMTYEIDKSFFQGLKKDQVLTTFPTNYETEEDVIHYNINVNEDYTDKLLYSQYWCGYDNTLIENQNWGTLEFTFIDKKAVDRFFKSFDK